MPPETLGRVAPPVEPQPVIAIEGACKRFATPEGGHVHALRDVCLDVGSNEFMTLLGPSGCGKTTLLRTISGFEDLDAGTLTIDGRPMAHVPPFRRPVNTVFQNYALFPHLSVGDNIGYGLDVTGCPRAERNQRVAAALDLVGLAGYERRRPRQLSGGQQQRVALARAIVNRPRVLLLDEPLSALDRKLREVMQVELKNIQNELGIAFVFVTHDQQEALTMSDRIVVMEHGRIRQVGSPTEVYDRPNTVFVAQFVGEGNLYHGTVGTDGDRLCLRTEEGLVIPMAGDEAPELVGQHACVLIRPEDLDLADGDRAPAADQAELEVQVRQTLFVGADFQVLAQCTGNLPIKAIVRDRSRRLSRDLEPGARIRLRYRLRAPRLLAAETDH